MNNQHFSTEALSAYLDGEATADESAGIDRHLAACATCAAQSRQLRAASSSVASLGPVEMTVDEHRVLRQAILGAQEARQPGVRSRRHLGRLQWTLAGAFAMVLIAALGFAVLGPMPGAGRGDQALTEAALPETATDSAGPATAGALEGALTLVSDADIEQAVRTLPEVKSGSALPRTDEPGKVPSVENPALAFGAERGSDNAQEGSAEPLTLDPDTTEGEAGRPASGGAEQFSFQAGQQCLAALASALTEPLSPLAARQASYLDQPAWLLVYLTDDGWFDAWLIDPSVCRTTPAQQLPESALRHLTVEIR
ncbi:MAG: anti-sigma factor family protein [Actinomycetota bacterium]